MRAIVDSMLKNIGVACTVLLCYFIVVVHPHMEDEYETETFTTVVVVFLSVVAYLLAKTVVAKAESYDRAQAAKASGKEFYHSMIPGSGLVPSPPMRRPARQ